MAKDRAFDLEGADAVSSALDHVVRPALEPEVAVGIAPGEITDGHPTVAEEALRAWFVSPVAERVTALGIHPHTDVPNDIRRDVMAFVVHDRHRAAGQRQPHRARPDLHWERIAVADRQAELARAVLIHHGDPPLAPEERHDLRVH